MENLLQGMNQVVVYINDILVTGENKEAHLANVQAVLAHQCPDGLEQPISFISRTLSPAEKNDSQLTP